MYPRTVLHPVHFTDKDKGNNRYPSAFIPFCDFGGNMTSMGAMIEEFDVPVCSSFQAKILNDQLCYEVDLNRYSNENNIERQLKSGFNFIMDFNEDRQAHVVHDRKEKDKSLASTVVESDEEQHALIYIDTIGINC